MLVAGAKAEHVELALVRISGNALAGYEDFAVGDGGDLELDGSGADRALIQQIERRATRDRTIGPQYGWPNGSHIVSAGLQAP